MRCHMGARAIEPVKYLSATDAIAMCTPRSQLCTPDFYEATLRIEPEGSAIVFDGREKCIAWKAIATIQHTPDLAVPAKQALRCCDQQRIVGIEKHTQN